MEYRITFYRTADGTVPLTDWLSTMKRSAPVLEKLLTTGLEKLRNSERHGFPLTRIVDRDNGIYELRVGSSNIARVFFFFQPGQEIVVTNGYVKRQQRLDAAELGRAQRYQQDWRQRQP